jgi:hypothetical protein
LRAKLEAALTPPPWRRGRLANGEFASRDPLKLRAQMRRVAERKLRQLGQ